jgi:ribonuclease T2
VGIYFLKVKEIFESLPTYQWLEKHGITPTTDGAYDLTDLEDALTTEAGVKPAIHCKGHSLSAVEWFFNVRGSVIDGEFVHIDTPENAGCPQTGIRYIPKQSKSDTRSSMSQEDFSSEVVSEPAQNVLSA